MKKKYIFFILISLSISFYQYFTSSTQKKIKSNNQKSQDTTIQKANSSSLSTKKTIISSPKLNYNVNDENPRTLLAISKEEKESIKYYTKILLDFTNQDFEVTDLIDTLVQKNLEPYMSIDENEYTGKMNIIRTKSTIPGTRYFHAQFFSDKHERSSLQHMSFEFRPGEKTFKQAIKFIREENNLSEPTFNEEKNFVSWDIKGEYVLWIKVLDYQDMKNDPFNAYEKSDLGTIRIVIEKEIH